VALGCVGHCVLLTLLLPPTAVEVQQLRAAQAAQQVSQVGTVVMHVALPGRRACTCSWYQGVDAVANGAGIYRAAK
jgi:hypothetical protein